MCRILAEPIRAADNFRQSCNLLGERKRERLGIRPSFSLSLSPLVHNSAPRVYYSPCAIYLAPAAFSSTSLSLSLFQRCLTWPRCSPSIFRLYFHDSIRCPAHMHTRVLRAYIYICTLDFGFYTCRRAVLKHK